MSLWSSWRRSWPEPSALSTELSQQLSLRYVVQVDGVSHQLPLRVTTTVVDRSPGSDAAQFRERLKQVSIALRVGPVA